MNMRLLLWMVYLLPLMSWGAITADSSTRSFSREMAVNADTQAEFYKRFPDLVSEEDTVTIAARELAIDGTEPTDHAKAAELLASRARELLAQRTPQEWQRKAVNLYPDLGVAGSEFNTLFLRHYKELEKSSPSFMQEPSWPVLLAHRCADELRQKAAGGTGVIKGAPVKPDVTTRPGPKPGSANRWLALLSFAVLFVIVALPARWLISCRNAFAGSEGPAILWQRALGPTAWAYLAVATIAAVQTFITNADQRPVDRFGITLLVSLMAGVVFAIPAYGASIGTLWWLGRRAALRPKPHSAPTSPETVPARENRA